MTTTCSKITSGDRLRAVSAHLDDMFEHMPGGFLDAGLTIRKNDMTYRWPGLNPVLNFTKPILSAHEQLRFAQRQEELAPLLRAFHDTCLDHPTLGPHLLRDPKQTLSLRWKKGGIEIEFANFHNTKPSFMMTNIETMCAMLDSLRRAPRFTKTLLFFTQTNEKDSFTSFLGRGHITQQSFEDIAPFLTADPLDTLATWVVPSDKRLRASRHWLAVHPQSNDCMRHTQSDTSDPDNKNALLATTLKNEFLALTDNMILTIPHPRSRAVLDTH